MIFRIYSDFNCSDISEMPFGNSSYHVETSQLICKANWLTGFYMVRVFLLQCISHQTIVLLLSKVDIN